MSDPYTRHPRPTLWLLRDGDAFVGGEGGDTEPPFEMEVEAFYISKSPVTNEEFEVFRPNFQRSPSSSSDLSPAVGVSFHEAAGYCDWYSERTGKNFRLPTEVEWEYACRAGTTPAWSSGNDERDLGEYAWLLETTNNIDEKYAHQVRLKKPNAFGLYDMHGNVAEWVLDGFNASYRKNIVDGTANPWNIAITRYPRIVKGGSWDQDQDDDNG